MKQIIGLCMLLLISIQGIAQENQSLELTLESAQNYAIEHNRAIQNSSLAIKQAEAKKWQAIAGMLPQVNAKYDYQNMLGYEMVMNMGPSAITIPLNPTGTASVTASVALNAQMVMGVYLSDIAKDLSTIQSNKQELDIRSQVHTLYLSILAMEQTEALLSKNLVNIETLYQTTQNAVNAGAAEQTQADQLMVQVSQMKMTINNTKRNVEMLYNSMRLTLGQCATTDIVLSQTIKDVLNPEKAMDLLGLKLDLDNNYDYQLLKKNTELSKKNVTMAALAYTPTVSAFYNYQHKDYFGEEAGFNMQPDDMVGVTVTMPLFTSFKTLSTVKEKKLAYRAAQNTLLDTEDALKVQDQQLRYNLNSAYENYEIQKNNIKVTESVFLQISQKYEVGVASSIELTTASTNLITAQSNYVQSLLQLVNADIALRKLLNQ